MFTRLVLAVLFTAMLSSHVMADFELTVLHTNDLHSRYDLIDQNGADCNDMLLAEGKCFIASARLATAISDARQRNPNVILLDAGDQFPTPRNPSPPETGRPLAAEIMNRLGYDAMSLGNHETDDGDEVLASFVDALSFPALTANQNLLANPDLAARLKSSIVLEVSGEDIGIIGMGSVGPNKPAETAQALVDVLQAAGINKIIAISHLGFENDKRLAENVTGIDIIVGGHSHTYLSNTAAAEKFGRTYPTWVNQTAIVHAFMFGTYLGELRAKFDDDGALISATGDPIPMGDVVDDDSILTLIESVMKEG